MTDLPPIFFPSSENIQAISKHVSSRFEKMLAKYNIPAAPEKIVYDNQGKMQLPADYPYTKELNQAFEDNPGIERELRTLNALTSHYVEMQKRQPFVEEFALATSQSAKDLIIAKYSHLLQDNHGYSSVALMFTNEGHVRTFADGKAVQLS